MRKMFVLIFTIIVALSLIACSNDKGSIDKEQPILAITIFKLKKNGKEQVAKVRRTKENEELFVSLEESLGLCKNAGPKADAFLANDRMYFEFKIKRQTRTELAKIWVYKDIVTIEQNNTYTKIEGKETKGFYTFLTGLNLDRK